MKRRGHALGRRYGHAGPPRPHVVVGPLPEGNVFWRDIPANARVVEMSHGWAVHFHGGKTATAFWGGQESREAQRWLRARAIKDAGKK